MKSNRALLLSSASLLVFGLMTMNCSPTAKQNEIPRRTGTNNGATNPNGTGQTPGGGGGNDADSANDEANLVEAEKFFDDQVQPAFRNNASPNCLNCHDAPRNVLNNPDAAGETIYEFSNMFALLGDGQYPNDNKLINILLGNANVKGGVLHPGTQICVSTDDELCALVIEWWKTAYGSEATGVKLGEIQAVSARGQVSGYAMDPEDQAKTFTVSLYLDGDSATGTKLGDATANTNAQINGRLLNKGFSFKIPDAQIDNAEHEIYAYTVNDAGEEVMLSGSPFKYTAYAPRGLNVVGNLYPAGSESCGGACHVWNYSTFYGALISPPPSEGGTAENNRLYRKASGAEAHNGPAVNINVATLRSWWNCEFLNQGCPGQ